MRTRFLVDNSVIQRLTKPEIREAWDRLRRRGEVATCLPTLLEAGFSARSSDDHHLLMDLEQRAKVVLPPTERTLQVALEIHSALFAAGLGRAVGISDVQIAATAICHGRTDQPVVVVHYDSDFDHLVAVEPRLKAEWIVPRGIVA